jgi:hypothetical protein
LPFQTNSTSRLSSNNKSGIYPAGLIGFDIADYFLFLLIARSRHRLPLLDVFTQSQADAWVLLPLGVELMAREYGRGNAST